MPAPRTPSPISGPVTPPPSNPNASSTSKLQYLNPVNSVLTPPTSPQQARSSSNDSEPAKSISAAWLQTPTPCSKFKEAGLDLLDTTVTPQKRTIEAELIECPFDVEIAKDDRGREVIFGTGAWSTVYKANTRTKPTTTSASLTPPLSPTVVIPAVVAIKKPARRDAFAILKSEARTLIYLQTIPRSEQHVVGTYGLVEEATIVMDAIPFSLEDHIRKCAAIAAQNISTSTMTEPVLGSVAKWFQLAQKLITALSWLHNEAHVIHGDVKPGNILLSQVRGLSANDITFEPVFADFSSSQRLDLEEMTPNTLSAVTREYTAPELLSSKILRDPSSTATTSSDVFSMALTLLVAATGQLLVYPGSVFQRQAMAIQGWMVLSHVRSGDGGMRVPRFGIVERVLERAVLKADMGRVNTQEWLALVETLAKGEPAKI